MEEQNNPHLLQEFEQEMYLEPASKGLRFANYIVDLIAYYILFIAFNIVWLLVVVSRGGNIDDSVVVDESGSAVAIQYLLWFVLFIAFFTIVEGASKGRSIGKLITGTVVVKENGAPITWKDALLRSLCRLIPFEPFSAFGESPWHDSITRTTVVRKTR